ncbi:MFS family major facilitator transporter, glycerol-3-phosphate cation symporter [Limosilactobacillus frumenti DSM 13145]|uniref:MFS family major facilitator transporter, glycerol-3-phosphate cation symporter n=1 Tax=Limosilactobacillus frumenti DSM 13145 TaxID=1423746 RepID=A0A0R1PF44_9LACO|nr:MFS transporter [Limosilactobacillus frumenti]KRL28597.1 MFS family major facilitator transporter, glycerol-3-phosphate cation symporter [Limosilactobacillus frumenti DSM 13145]QFG72335.1 MFS transporter [Limosilactobacillus frumenti]
MLSFLKPAPDAKVKVPKERISSVYKWRQTGVLLSICIGYIGYYVIRLIFTTEQNDIMKQYGFTTAEVGMVLSCFGIGYGISKLFMGALSDKSNPNRYLATGLILSALLNFGLGATKNLYVMMILMLVMSVAQGMGAAACQRIVQLWWCKKHRGAIYSIWSSAHNAGAFVCVAVVQLATFMFAGSIPAVFYTASVVSLIIAAFVLLAGSDRPTTVGLPSISEYTGDEVITEDGKKTSLELTKLTLPQIFVKYILTNKVVWAITLTSMSLYLVRYGIMSWIPSYLVQSKGFSPAFAKWLVGIFELASVPGVIIMGAISDALKGRRALVCIACVVLLILCLTVYFFSSNHAFIVTVLFIMGTLIYAPLTLVGLMVNEAVPKFAVGSSTGFMGFFQYIFGETLATALIGILVSKFGWVASNSVLYTASALALVLLIYILINENRVAKEAAEN